MTRSGLRSLVPVLLCLCLASPSFATEEGEDSMVGQPAPAFELGDLEGNPLKLQDLVGKKVVWLNFWGLRCGPCVRELPALEALYQKYKDRGLLIVAVNADGVDAEFIKGQLASRDELKSIGITFPIAPDPEFAAVDAYGLMGAPLNVFIDRNGVVQQRHEGYESGDEVGYAATVERLLGQ